MAGYTCRSCSFYGTLLQVVEHNRNVHVSHKYQNTHCCICSHGVTSRKLRLHIRRRHGSHCTVRCSACNEPFVAEIDLRNHVTYACKRRSGNDEQGVWSVVKLSSSLTSAVPANFDIFLKNCGPDDVHKYISQHLQTDESYRKECSDVVDRVATFFMGKNGFKLNRFIKGGSLGKGTALKSKSDIDCVMFTSDLPPIDSDGYQDDLETLLKWAKDQLKTSSSSIAYNLEVIGRTKHAVKLRVQTHKKDHAAHDVDLLLATDLLGEDPTNAEKTVVYNTMARLDDDGKQNCSAALVELQRDFVKEQPAEVKDLIRLVKMWKKSCVWETSLTSYPLELLCIHVWTHHSNVAAAFKAVLQKLSNYGSISAHWTINYSYSRAQPMLGKRPLILDPANPYNNVADRCWNWSAVARAAQETLRKPFFSRY